MKKQITIAIGTLLVMGLMPVAGVAGAAISAHTPQLRMQGYAVDAQPTSLGTAASKPAAKPKTKKKTTTKKPAAKKTTTKKPAAKKPAATKKPAAKKTTTKKTTAKKTTAKPKDTATTATEVNSADLGGKTDMTVDASVGDASAPGDVSQSDLPEASPDQPRGSTAKGLTIAGLASASGLGLIYLLKKMFWH